MSQQPLEHICGSDSLWRAPAKKVALFFLALCLVFFGGILIKPGMMMYGWDMVQGYYYLYGYGFGQLRAGHVPHWNPYILCGFPFMADPQNGVFYPINFIFLFLPAQLGINYSIIIHILLMGVFTFFLARELGIDTLGSAVAGLVMMFNGLTIGKITLGSCAPLNTIAWFPCLLLFIKKLDRQLDFRRISYLGLVVAIAILAGHPQFIYYNIIGAGVFALYLWFCRWRRTGSPWSAAALLGGILAAGAMGGLLASFQILPSAEAVSMSARVVGAPIIEIGASSLPPMGLMGLVAPEFFGDFVNTRYWGVLFQPLQAVYIGILPLILIIFGLLKSRLRRQAVFWAGFTFLFFLIAMGHFTPFFHLMLKVPGFKNFRMISRILCLSMLGMALLAGMGAGPFALWLRRGKWGRKSWLGIGASGAFFLALLIGMLLMPQGMWKSIVAKMNASDLHPLPVDLSDAALLAALKSAALLSVVKSVVIFAVLAALVAVFRSAHSRQWRLAKLAPVALLLLMFGDLFAYGHRYIIPYDPADFRYPSPIVDLLKGKNPDDLFRIVTYVPVEVTPLPGLMAPFFARVNEYNQSVYTRSVMYRIFNAAGRLAIFDGRYQQLTTGADTFEHVKLTNELLENLLNIKYVLYPAGDVIQARPYDEQVRYIPTETGLEEVLKAGNLAVYRRKGYLPRFWLAERARVVPDAALRIKLLSENFFFPLNEVILESEFKGIQVPQVTQGLRASPNADIPPVPKIMRYEPEYIELEINARFPSILVSSEVYYPSWKTWIDGKPAQTLRVNHAFRGVEVPLGAHRVVMRFVPRLFQIGLLISLSTLTGMLISIFIIAARDRRAARDRVWNRAGTREKNSGPTDWGFGE